MTRGWLSRLFFYHSETFNRTYLTICYNAPNKTYIGNLSEEKMNKEKIRKIAFAALILAIVFAVVGTILMFLTKYQDSYTYSYSYYTSYWTVYCPEVGAMPLVGTVLLIVSLVLFAASKKRASLSLVSGIIGVIGVVLLLASYAVLEDSTKIWLVENGDVGYDLCATAGSLAFLVSVFSIVTYYRDKQLSAANASKTEAASAQNDDYAMAKRNSELRDAKALFDEGILNADEYESEKARIIAKYGRD